MGVSMVEAVEFARQFLNSPILQNDMKASPPQEHEHELIVKALRLAAINPDTNDFDALLVVAADLLYQGKMLPKWLADFTADVISGKKKRPTKRGPDKYVNWERDYKLWRATQEVAKKFNLPLYSSPGRLESTTAAEIVSLAANCNVDVVIAAYKKFTRLTCRR